jgi:hypothetical protein
MELGDLRDWADSSILSRLLADDHPWVIRDALTATRRLGDLIDETRVGELFDIGAAGVARCISAGWEKSELLSALLSLAAVYPEVLASRMWILDNYAP